MLLSRETRLAEASTNKLTTKGWTAVMTEGMYVTVTVMLRIAMMQTMAKMWTVATKNMRERKMRASTTKELKKEAI